MLTLLVRPRIRETKQTEKWGVGNDESWHHCNSGGGKLVCKYSYEQIPPGAVQKGTWRGSWPSVKWPHSRDRPNTNPSVSLCPLALLTLTSPNVKLGQWALPVSQPRLTVRTELCFGVLSF